MRICPGTDCDRCRPASPSGPTERMVTTAQCWSPRRSGCSRLTIAPDFPAATSTGCVRGRAQALGAQASRSTPRNRREPSLCTRRTASTGWPSQAAVSPGRAKRSLRGLPARATSMPTAAASTSASTTNAVAGHGDSAIGSTQISAITPVRPVRTTIGAPVLRPGCRPALRPGWHPRARPPVGAQRGVAASAGPATGRIALRSRGSKPWA